MALTIQWTALAEEQLKNIFVYKIQEKNNSSAKRFINKLVSYLDILQFNPYLAKKEKLFIDYPYPIFSLSFNKYKLIFHKDEDVVTVLSVLDERQFPETK